MVHFDDLQIEPRLKQLAMPLSIIFQLWAEGLEGFKEYLIARQAEVRRQRALSWEGTLFNTVLGMASDDSDADNTPQAVTPTMVSKHLSSSPKTVTQGLASIGFEVEQRWIDGFDKQGNPKNRQVRAYVIPNNTIYDEIISRYWYTPDGAEPPLIPTILRSRKYCSVYKEASQASQASQAPQKPVIDVTHVTDNYTGNNRGEERLASKCHACGGTDFWMRGTERICQRCHPAP